MLISLRRDADRHTPHLLWWFTAEEIHLLSHRKTFKSCLLHFIVETLCSWECADIVRCVLSGGSVSVAELVFKLSQVYVVYTVHGYQFLRFDGE